MRCHIATMEKAITENELNNVKNGFARYKQIKAIVKCRVTLLYPFICPTLLFLLISINGIRVTGINGKVFMNREFDFGNIFIRIFSELLKP